MLIGKHHFLTVGAMALAMAIAAPAAAQQKSVAVTAIVEHPALDAVRDGVQDALKQAGYEPGKNLKWQYQSAQGNNGTAAQIARKFVGDRPDAVLRQLAYQLRADQAGAPDNDDQHVRQPFSRAWDLRR